MKILRLTLASTLALVAAQQAHAQVAFHGVRAEGHVGADRFYSEGVNDTKLGFGGAVGVDFRAGNIVFGPEGTFWKSDNENE